jgi:enamine deaminase RidA (YjgF/YER057c/UK114 family)
MRNVSEQVQHLTESERKMTIESRLKELGFELPPPPPAVGNYIGSRQSDNILFVGGNTGRVNGKRKFTGKVGGDVTLEQAYEMAQFCALNHVAGIKAVLGDLERVDHMIMLTGYVNVAPGFTQLPAVINGASDFIVKLWGERGEHTRCAIGVASLGSDAPVETTLVLRVKS